MLAHSQDFKEAFTRLGRDIKVRIGYYKGTAYLKTQDNKLLLTENNMKLLGDVVLDTPFDYIYEDDIMSLSKNNLGELFRTYMKSFDLKTSREFEMGEKLTIEIGTTVNNAPEYLNYGLYYVYTKNYNKAEKCFEYTICDGMLKTMIPYKEEYINWDTNNETKLFLMVEDLLHSCGISRVAGINYPNLTATIKKEMFDGIDITCRDILDNAFQLTGYSLIMGISNNQEWAIPTPVGDTAVDTIDEDLLKDTKVDFKDKFGPLNAVVTTRSGGYDSLEATDDTSIEQDGRCEYVIKDNLILDKSDERPEILDELLNGIYDEYTHTYIGGIDGLEYYENEIDTIGVGYIEYLDTYNTTVDGETYKCLCLKNTASIESGMEEEYKGEPPTERSQTYENVCKDDKTASIISDQLKGEIVLKATSDGRIAQVRLDGNVEESGSLIEINADNINLNGYTHVNSGFHVTTDGDVVIDKGYVRISGDRNTASIWVTEDNTGYYSYMYPDHTDVTDGVNSNVSYSNYSYLTSTNSNNEIQINLNTSGTPYIYLTDGTKSSTVDTTYIYTDGDLTVGGDLNVSGSKNRVVDIGDKKILMNAYETAEAYFGDIGSGKTDNNGECRIEIDQTFSKTIDTSDYKVFVQECGNGKLYVEKYEDYFIVKGTPNLSFDYEIKAKQKGYENVRLEEQKKINLEEVKNGRR